MGKNEKRSKGLLGLIYRFSRLTVVFSFGIDNRGNHGKWSLYFMQELNLSNVENQNVYIENLLQQKGISHRMSKNW